MDALTEKELRVLAYLSLGIKEGSYQIGLSHHTFKSYCSIAYEKLDVHSQAQAWIKLGWLKIPEQYGVKQDG